MYITINVIMRCFANISTTGISKVSKHINWLIMDATHHDCILNSIPTCCLQLMAVITVGPLILI